MFTFKTITDTSESLLKVKGSKFVAIAQPVKSENEFKLFLNHTKKNYHDAGHHCYAFRIGNQGDFYRFSDDGEPASTAGKPIYGQLLSFDITNVAVVVIRYFGGTKLGVGGLISAYKEAARLALEGSLIIEKTINFHIEISYSYEQTSMVMSAVKHFDMEIINQEFKTECRVTLSCPLNLKKKLIEFLQQDHTLKFTVKE